MRWRADPFLTMSPLRRLFINGLRSDCGSDLVEQLHRRRNLALRRRGQRIQRGRERLDSASLSGPHQRITFSGRGDQDGTAVGGVRLPLREAGVDQAINDPGHRRACYPFGARQLAQRARPAEDQHGQRRQPRWGEPSEPVHVPEAPEYVNRPGVQSRGRILEIGLALCHNTCIACLPIIDSDATYFDLTEPRTEHQRHSRCQE